MVGGEIYYDYLGNNNYQITLIVYRDCGPTNSNNTQFDNLAPIAVYNNGNLVTSFNVQKSPSTLVPVNLSNPCLVAPPSACVEEARYISTINLPPIAGGYDIAYQRCCRNPSTQNIFNPNTQGSTYLATIPGDPSLAQNSSPRFTDYPPTVLCVNNLLDFDHSATDLDGDSLTYELCTPYTGASAANPAPTALPPPYNSVLWNPGYSVTNQIQGSPTLSIDANTGLLTGFPTLQGIYTFGVCVKEYRNGLLLSESRRDFQFWITNCDPLLTASVPTQIDSCASYTVSFSNNSIGATSFSWDFGDGNTSTQANPTHTYAMAGTYQIMLIANPSWPCADTTIVSYTIKDPMDVYFDRPAPQCITNNNFSFLAQGNFPNGSSFSWDFGSMAIPIATTGINPTNIIFLDSGKHLIRVTVEDQGCTAEFVDTINVFGLPEIGAILPSNEGCVAYEVQFFDSSFSSTPLSYIWDFGNGDTSHAQNPFYTYTDTGYFDVGLTISTDSGCIASLDLFFPNAVHVLPSPVSLFDLSPKETDIFSPFFQVIDMSHNGVVDLFYLDSKGDTIGLGADGRHVVNDTGWVDVEQWVFNKFGCSDSSIQRIYIEPITTIYVPNSFTPDGDGVNDVWLPEVKDVFDYELLIFNRWGQTIFTTNDQYQGWSGSFKDKISPTDVYIYKIRYRAMDRIQREHLGHITLIR